MDRADLAAPEVLVDRGEDLADPAALAVPEDAEDGALRRPRRREAAGADARPEAAAAAVGRPSCCPY